MGEDDTAIRAVAGQLRRVGSLVRLQMWWRIFDLDGIVVAAKLLPDVEVGRFAWGAIGANNVILSW